MISIIKSKPKVAIFSVAVIMMAAFVAYPAFIGVNALDFVANHYWLILLALFPVIVVVGIAKTRLSLATDAKYELLATHVLPSGKNFDANASDLGDVYVRSFLFSLRKRSDAEKNLATGISMTALAMVMAVILVVISQAPQVAQLPRDEYIWKYIVPKAAVVLFVQFNAFFFLRRYSKNLSISDAVEFASVRQLNGIALLNLIRSDLADSDQSIKDFVRISLTQPIDLRNPAAPGDGDKPFEGFSKLIESLSLSFGK